MHFWHSAPLIRILFPCLAAIFCGIYIPLTAEYCLWTCIASLFAWLLIQFIYKKPSYKSRWINGLFIQSTVFSLFCWYSVNYNELRSVDHFSHPAPADAYLIRVSSEPEEKARSWKCFAQVEALCDSNRIKACSGQILVYLNKDNTSAPRRGDAYLIRSAVTQC